MLRCYGRHYITLNLIDQESPPHFENRIKPRVNVRGITRTRTVCMYEKAHFGGPVWGLMISE